ncbi:phage tail domain-containing protein [Jeotgalibaca porci]|uniref:phage tail domain-containing protein n=1 Tax=Jeotgalibaca porci TaxID=1868793 RepID=UPI00359F15E6
MVRVNGKHESEFGLVQVMGHTNPATPEFSNQWESIPGNSESYYFGTKIEPKPLSIPFLILDCTIEEAQERVDKYIPIFMDDLGNPEEVELIYDYDLNRYYKARLISVSGPTRENYRMSSLELNFMAYDPHRYSTVQNDEVTWGSEVLTFSSSIYTLGHENSSAEFTLAGPGTIPVNVTGLALHPVIKIEGSATSLIIENAGKKIEIGTFDNASWIIDTGKYISWLNGTEKIIKMDKFMLRNGLNNIKFTGSNLNIEVTLRFRDRWL